MLVFKLKSLLDVSILSSFIALKFGVELQDSIILSQNSSNVFYVLSLVLALAIMFFVE